ncbi:hypothetical protein CQA66_07015 [Helicobacter aurati]|uniref:Glycosyl transferase family 1 domain-containing protein n=1 Tax=Helicobacter aurati TaxID=137778 RepID=A0A3D8J1D8_9HELI|nr:glycosyltransferase [Helicobacter aurati]RDU71040.1 hypothetical protein CQA66_07015 [Helicobacter aurati]
MKILFTCENLALQGGAERVIVNMANELYARGYQVEILSYFKDSKTDKPCHYPLNPAINIAYLYPHDKPKRKGIARIIWRLFGYLFVNLAMNKKCRADIIIESHFSMFYPRFKAANTQYIKIMHMQISRYKKRKNGYFDALVFLSQNEYDKWHSYHSNALKITNFVEIPFETMIQEIEQKNILSDERFLRILDSILAHHCRHLCLENKQITSLNPYYNEEDFLLMRAMLLSYILYRESDTQDLNNTENCYSKILQSKAEESQDALFCHSSLALAAKESHSIDSQRDSSVSTKLQNKRDSSCNQEAFTILAVGRMSLEDQKGFPRLIQSYSKIATHFPQWKLKIIGADYGQKPLLQEQIQQLNMQDYILLKNFTPNIQKEYLLADIYAMSSYIEGMPMVLIEAMSNGMPLVAYDIAPIRECFDNNGILVNSEEAFCQALRSLMQNADLRIAMGQQSLRLAKERFSKESVMQQYCHLFHSLKP